MAEREPRPYPSSTDLDVLRLEIARLAGEVRVDLDANLAKYPPGHPKGDELRRQADELMDVRPERPR